MSDEKSQETTITSPDQLPGGLLGQDVGESQDQVARGLFDALSSDPESLGVEDLELEESNEDGDDDADDHSGDDEEDLESDEDDELESGEDEGEEDEEDEESEDGDDADDELLELNDDLMIEDVPIPGGTTSVTLGELKAGYSRQEDYTRKRQAAAEEYRNVMAEIGETRSLYKGRLNQVKRVLEDMAPPEPSEELRRENPGEYAAQVAERRDYLDSISRVESEVASVSQEEKQERLAQLQAHRDAEWSKVVSRYPEWENNEVALPELAKLQKFAMTQYGFAEQELDGLVDSRLFFMLKDVYDSHEQDAAAAETVKKKRKKSKRRLKPGASQAGKKGKRRTKRKKIREAVDKRARETGSVVDAAASLELMLADEDDL